MTRPRRLTHADVRRIALALPETKEGSHMQHADLRVGAKIFASLPDEDTVVVKASPADLDFLTESNPESFRSVWGGRWLRVTLSRVSRPALKELLENSWSLTAPRKWVASREVTIRGKAR